MQPNIGRVGFVVVHAYFDGSSPHASQVSSVAISSARDHRHHIPWLFLRLEFSECSRLQGSNFFASIMCLCSWPMHGFDRGKVSS